MTPMQEHIKWLKERHKHYSSQWEMDIVAGLEYAINHAKQMLEKEKKVMCEFADRYVEEVEEPSAMGRVDFKISVKQYYDETFNTKEK